MISTEHLQFYDKITQCLEHDSSTTFIIDGKRYYVHNTHCNVNVNLY